METLNVLSVEQMQTLRDLGLEVNHSTLKDGA